MSLSEKRTAAGKRITLLVVSLMLAVITLSAQTTNRVTVTKERITLRELFREIERQTNSIVMVSPEKTDWDWVATLSQTEGTVPEILGQALRGSGQEFQTNGRYITITPVKQVQQPVVAALPPQPTQAEFERDVNNYSNRNLQPANTQPTTTVRYDTVCRQVGHTGIFTYPDRHLNVTQTHREIIRNGQPYLFDTPPALAIKTNLLYWATVTPNLSLEFGLGPKTSLDIMGSYNPWNLDGTYEDNKKLVHWIVRPEFRYWLCERFSGHFFGAHGFYWQYNISQSDVPMLFDKEYRYEGNAFGLGISYGYHWAFAQRWGVEFNIGAGVAFMDYTKKDCVKCGNEVGDFTKTYFGPTNIGIKLVYMIK